MNHFSFKFLLAFLVIAFVAKSGYTQIKSTYTGIYASNKNQSTKFKVYIENGLLYIKSENPAAQLVPFTKDGFFMYENEKINLFYKEENNKKFFEAGTKEDRIVKVE